MLTSWAKEILYVWFQLLEPSDWFGQQDEVDALLDGQFGSLHDALRTQPARSFLANPRMALAGVLLFDQVPRNIYRGQAIAFETDPLARQITDGAIARGHDRRLSRQERQFLYMPMMHSEAISDQLRSLALYRQLGRGYGWAFARSHYRVVAQFGRYPHRNETLGRTTTTAEARALQAGLSW